MQFEFDLDPTGFDTLPNGSLARHCKGGRLRAQNLALDAQEKQLREAEQARQSAERIAQLEAERIKASNDQALRMHEENQSLLTTLNQNSSPTKVIDERERGFSKRKGAFGLSSTRKNLGGYSS